MRVLVVGDGGERGDLRVRGGERCREHWRVGLVDLARCERLSWAAELRSRAEDGDARSARARHSTDAGCSQRADVRGGQSHPRWDNDVASTNVTTARTDVVALANRFRNLDLVVTLDNILDGDDGIGAVRDDTAGGDCHRLTRAERAVRGSTCRYAIDDRQPTRRILCADRKPV